MRMYFWTSVVCLFAWFLSVFKLKVSYLEAPQDLLLSTANLMMLLSYSHFFKKVELLLSIYE